MGGRFNPKGVFTVYLCTTRSCAVAEYDKQVDRALWLAQNYSVPVAVPRKNLYKYSVDLDKCGVPSEHPTKPRVRGGGRQASARGLVHLSQISGPVRSFFSCFRGLLGDLLRKPQGRVGLGILAHA